MKLSTISSAPFITLLGLVGSVSAGSRCIRQKGSGDILHQVTMEGVGSENVGSLCKGLWDNLKRHPGCMVFRPNGCEEGNNKGELYWYFTTTMVCNSGMVHSAFWEATESRWGAINCE
ncbi:hypothetical protein LX36DRAFT_666083 [Colletotrichum falcatum]|nr:hypothetical protein LX36DRAFT_666083 [Colletotrichum falcatum]